MDLAVHEWFQAQRHPVLTPLMLAVTWLHGTGGLLALVLLLAVLLWRRGETGWILPLAVSVPGAMLLNVALKHLVQRERPFVADPVLTLETYSFPSGHAAGAAAFYTFLACWLLARAGSRAGRMAVVAGAVFMMAWVDLSRVYLGVHYISDVLAGTLVGALWVLAWLGWLRRRQPGALQP